MRQAGFSLRLILGAATIVGCCCPAIDAADGYVVYPRRRVYSALDAGLDAFHFHDEVRREQIAHQLDLNNQMLLNSYGRFYTLTAPDPFDSEPDCPPGWPLWSVPPVVAPAPSEADSALRSVRIGQKRVLYRVRKKVEELPAPQPQRPRPSDAEPIDISKLPEY